MPRQVAPLKFRTFRQAAGLIGEMIREGAVDPDVRKKALEIIAPIREGNAEDELTALLRFAQRGVAYRNDPFNADLYQTPNLTLENLSGDCDDKVILLGSLAGSVGYPVMLAFLFDEPVGAVPDLEADSPVHVFLYLDAFAGTNPDPYWMAAETITVPVGRDSRRFLNLGEAWDKGYVETIPL